MKLRLCIFGLFTLLPSSTFQLQQQQPQLQTVDVAKPGLHDILIKTVHDTATYLGFGVKCKNGGHKTEDNTCVCPKYFRGKECEHKICINGGRLEKMSIPNVHHVCRCPHPQYINGGHCEKVQCDHGGILKTFQNGTWNCDCTITNFYQGTFCEKFILSTGWILAFTIIGILIIAVFVCSKNWFKRNRQQNRQRTVRTTSALPRDQRRTASNHRAGRSSSADDLISSERGAHRRTAAYPDGIGQHYVVRLDTIPTFNPTMIGGVEPMNNDQPPVGPPPSYDQAMSSMRIEPPEYTPTDRAKLDA